MSTKASLLRELKEMFGKRWPLDLRGVIGEIGSGIRISREVKEEHNRFWDLNHEFLHKQSEGFIQHFYTTYTTRNAKAKTKKRAN